MTVNVVCSEKGETNEKPKLDPELVATSVIRQIDGGCMRVRRRSGLSFMQRDRCCCW